MEVKLQRQAPQKAQADKPNLTGIPTQMKLDFEQRSGLSFDDVRVHYNSDKPAQLQALAYTQGTQVYVGPRQERHLPHELGHVAQQKQGRVKANRFVNNMPVNIDASLEHEADSYLPKAFTATQQSYLGKDIIPIQCRMHFSWNKEASDEKWKMNPDERPKFTDYVERKLPIRNSPEVRKEDKQSRNHIMPYQMINKIIGKTIADKLNKGNYTPIEDKHSGYPQNASTLEIQLRQLVTMIMPKRKDYVIWIHTKNLPEVEIANQQNKAINEKTAILHGLAAGEEHTSLSQKIEEDKKTYQEYLEAADKEIAKFHEEIEKERNIGKELTSQIVLYLSQTLPPTKISVPHLDALANELEFHLFNSVGNMRIGYSSTNSSIQDHIDILGNSFSYTKIPEKDKESSMDTEPAPMDIESTPMDIESTFTESFENVGDDDITIKFVDDTFPEETTQSIGSKSYNVLSESFSMRKRMTHLYRLGSLFKDSTLSGFYFAETVPGNRNFKIFSSEKSISKTEAGEATTKSTDKEKESAKPRARESRTVKIEIKPVTSKRKKFHGDPREKIWKATSKRIGGSTNHGPYAFVADEKTDKLTIFPVTDMDAEKRAPEIDVETLLPSKRIVP